MLHEKYSVSALSRVKTIKLSLWYQESVHNSVIVAVISSQNPKAFRAFAGDLDFVHNSECPQYIAGCPQGES